MRVFGVQYNLHVEGFSFCVSGQWPVESLVWDHWFHGVYVLKCGCVITRPAAHETEEQT